MKKLKLISLISGLLLVIIQFVRPTLNISDRVPVTDISHIVAVPAEIGTILHNACYDCHSNNTRYPWYSKVQPVGWLLSSHITKARKMLNFNDFGSYSQRRQSSKLDGIANSMHDNTMPLPSYRLMHQEARLSKDERERISAWAENARDSLSNN